MCSGRSQAEDMRKRRRVKNGIVPGRGRAELGASAGRAHVSSGQNASSIASPASMLTRPRKRIWPSLICERALEDARATTPG